MVEIHELETSLIIGLYEDGRLNEQIETDSYKTKLGSYNVDINFIIQDWELEECVEYEEEYDYYTQRSKAIIKAFYDKITVDNMEGYFVDILPKQRCLKVIVGYEGIFYTGFEVLFQSECDCKNFRSFRVFSNLLLQPASYKKQIKIKVDKNTANINYFDDNFKMVNFNFDYTIGKPIDFTLEGYIIKGQVNLSIPCEISFSYDRMSDTLKVKVENIIFYVEDTLEFSVNSKVANFEIIKI